MLQVPRNANSMLAAIRRQLGIKCVEFDEDPFFPNRHLRRFIGVALVRWRSRIMDRYGNFLKCVYG